MPKDIVRARDWRRAESTGPEMSLDFEAYAIPLIIGDRKFEFHFLYHLFEVDEGPQGDFCYTPHQLIFFKHELAVFLTELGGMNPDEPLYVQGHEVKLADVREVVRRLAALVELAIRDEEFLFAFAD